MCNKNSATPVLQEGMAYTIILKEGQKIRNAIYYACVASGKPYFGKGNDIYPVEEVQSHSLIGHNVPDDYQQTEGDDRLVITDEEGGIVEIITTPSVNPNIFRRRVRCLMLSGLSQDEAEKDVATIPLKLELFYDIGRGIFAIDAEAVGNTPLYNPYTGREIPDKTE